MTTTPKPGFCSLHMKIISLVDTRPVINGWVEYTFYSTEWWRSSFAWNTRRKDYYTICKMTMVFSARQIYMPLYLSSRCAHCSLFSRVECLSRENHRPQRAKMRDRKYSARPMRGFASRCSKIHDVKFSVSKCKLIGRNIELTLAQFHIAILKRHTNLPCMAMKNFGPVKMYTYKPGCKMRWEFWYRFNAFFNFEFQKVKLYRFVCTFQWKQDECSHSKFRINEYTFQNGNAISHDGYNKTYQFFYR